MKQPPRWLNFVAVGLVGMVALVAGWVVEARDGRLEAATSARLHSQDPTPTRPDPLEHAVQDLMRRLSVERSAITVISVEDVTWSDTALGCPQPDQGYAQVLTTGQRIRLEAGGRIYSYHGGPTGVPVYCENPKEPVSIDSAASGPAPLPVASPSPGTMTEHAPPPPDQPR
jgi:hypothetical protein